ncbi:hypothetical protein FHT92_005160 [Rhizobium sp. BK377]|nr:hypothetical protein [Rhizobium sp. BK377]
MNLKFKHAGRFASNSACGFQSGAADEKRSAKISLRSRKGHPFLPRYLLGEIVSNGCTDDLAPRGPIGAEMSNSIQREYSTDNMWR